MNRFRVFTAAMAIVALPTGVLGEPHKEKPFKVKDNDKNAQSEKSVPALPALVLIGVGAGVAGLMKYRDRRRRTRGAAV